MFRIRRQRHKEPLAKQTQFTKQRNLYRTNMFIGLFKSGRTTINSSLICVKNVQKVFMQNTLMALNKVNINVDWEMELKKKKVLQSYNHCFKDNQATAGMLMRKHRSMQLTSLGLFYMQRWAQTFRLALHHYCWS